MGRLVGAVVIVLVTDGPGSTRHPVGPVTPLVSWVVQQLLSSPHVAGFLFWSPLVALVVLDAVVRVREDAARLGAGEVDGRRVRLARASVAVPFAAADLLGEVAPLMDVIVQVVSLAEHVTGAAFIALPVHGAVIRVFVEEGSVAVWADLVVGQ